MKASDPNAPARPLDLLVTLAVHDGEPTLGRVLEAYCRVRPPHGSWALAIVDNASADGTADVIAAYAPRLPIIALHQARPGKNAALNLALETVRPRPGAYIFTDDDAVPNPDFLVAWEAALAEAPEAVLFGGAIEALFMEPPPAWLRRFDRYFLELYGQLEPPLVRPGSVTPFGCNMAVRGSVIEGGLRFFEGIGPNHADPAYPMGSETEFNRRVIARTGRPAHFDPRPRVGHLVRPWQMTRAFVAARAFRHGRGVAVQRRHSGRPAGRSLRESLAGQILLGLLSLIGAPRAVWAFHWTRGLRSEQAPEGRASSAPIGRPDPAPRAP